MTQEGEGSFCSQHLAKRGPEARRRPGEADEHPGQLDALPGTQPSQCHGLSCSSKSAFGLLNTYYVPVS